MTIHAHIIVWNEEKILPYTLKHYLQFCDKITIWDNGSTDRTFQIIADHNVNNNIFVRKFDTQDTFDDWTNMTIKNHAWKTSKGEADYVIVADCDEFVYHPNIKEFLAKNSGYTFVVPQWYEMVSDELPTADGLLTDIVKTGWMNPHSKMLLFKLEGVNEVNWSVGAHEVKPIAADASTCYDQAIKTLHYKYLSAEYVINRYKETTARFSDTQKRAGFGVHHKVTADEIIKQHDYFMKNSVKVVL